jgi:predicted metal-dependent hydrolase
MNIPWPPPYALKISSRAKHIGFRIHPYKGLEVTVPKRLQPQNITSTLEKHRAWIERHLSRVQSAIRPNEPEFPQMLNFQALQEQWQILYEANDLEKKLHLKISEAEKIIYISGNAQNKKLVHEALNRFLAHHAKKHLIPWLQQLSVKHNLPFSRSSIRHAKTLWGSCNSKKNISLNSRLLFLPFELIEYVILHELCHTIHLNHSQRFWQLLTQGCENCLALRKQLRKADQHLPLWILQL